MHDDRPEAASAMVLRRFDLIEYGDIPPAA
jgi:hypothetical protein